MSTATAQPMQSNERDVYDRFILALGDDNTSLPRDTLLGAISHFLGTLETSDLERLLPAVAKSRRLWSHPDASKRTRQALTLGVVAAVNRLEGEQKSRWSWGQRRSDEWVSHLSARVTEDKIGERAMDVQCALLRGAADAQDVSEGTRVQLEEDVIMGLEPLLRGRRGIDLLSEVAEHVAPGRLQLLDVSALISHVQWLVLRRMEDEKEQSDIPAHSRLLARLFKVLVRRGEVIGPVEETLMLNFAEDMRIDRGYHAQSTASSSDTAWKARKTRLFAFLTPSSAILDILLKQPNSYPSSSRSHDTPPYRIALELLWTLSRFADVIDASTGGLEGYDRVLNGLLDVLVAEGGAGGVKRLFDRVDVEHIGPAKAAWWMVVGESVIRHVDTSTMKMVLKPLMDRYIVDPKHRGSFEAAHSLKLAYIQAAAESAIASREVADVEILSDAQGYCALLVQQCLRKDITQDQLRSAYPLVISSISSLDPSSVTPSLSHLTPLQTKPAHTDTGHTQYTHLDHLYTSILISCSPYLPPDTLASHLHHLGELIKATPVDGARREELMRSAHGMVLKDLPDSSRVRGMEWWDALRRGIERQEARVGGRSGRDGEVRAKL